MALLEDLRIFLLNFKFVRIDIIHKIYHLHYVQIIVSNAF